MSVDFKDIGCYILRNNMTFPYGGVFYMKKILVIAAALLAVLMFTSCVSTADDIEGTGVKLSANKPEIIDYQGQTFGSRIPGWVVDASDGKWTAVQKGLDLEGRKVWILQNVGQDLDMLKLWTSQIDGRSQIASGIEQTVADLITAEMSATSDAASTQKMVDEFSSRITNLTLQGLEQTADFWTYTRTAKVGVKRPKTQDDYDYKYTYLVVFSMDEDLFEQQIQAAFADVGDNDDQAAMLREVVTAQLMNKLENYAVN